MNTTAPRRVIRLALPDKLHARLAAEAIEAFEVAAIGENGDPVSAIPPDAAGKRRLGTFLMALKTGGMQAAPIVRFGPYRLDSAYAVLNKEDGTTVTLTEKERDILVRLHGEDGNVLDRKTLLDDVWGYADTVETHTLETHIYRLRRKIEDDPGAPRWLVTEEPGYRLSRE